MLHLTYLANIFNLHDVVIAAYFCDSHRSLRNQEKWRPPETASKFQRQSHFSNGANRLLRVWLMGSVRNGTYNYLSSSFICLVLSRMSLICAGVSLSNPAPI